MKWTRKLLLLLTSLCLVLSCALIASADGENVSTGIAGEGVTYTMDYDTRILTIRGNGPMDGRFRCPGNAKKIIIEDGVTWVDGGAFMGHAEVLESVEIAGSAERIDSSAFSSIYGMNTLTEVILHEGVQWIGSNNFSNSPNLRSVVFPSTLAQIASESFRYSGLTEVTFLGAPPLIGENVFANAVDEEGELLTLTVYYPDDGTWTESDMRARGRSTIYIPFTLDVQGNRVPDISRAYTPQIEGVFQNGGNWRIDEFNVLHIEGAADITTNDPNLNKYWEEVSALVVEPGVKTFYHDFVNLDLMTTVTFSDDLKVGPTFQYCDVLENVDLGKGLTVLRKKNFYKCGALHSIHIPASVTDIYDTAFYYTAITQAVFWGDRPNFHFENSETPNVLNGMRDNWSCPLDEETGLMTLVVHAFYTPGNTTWTTDLNQLVLGNTTRYVPFTVASDGRVIGDYDNALTVLGIVDYWLDLNQTTGGYGISHTLYANGHAVIEVVDEKQAQIYGNTLSCLKNGYGSCWDQVKHIEIREGIKAIRGQILNQDITHEITFDLPSTLTEIITDGYGRSPFAGLEGIKSLDLSHVTKIGKDAFSSCSGLETVILGEGLTEIPDGAFYMSGIKSIAIPASVTSIGKQAFMFCDALETVEMSGGLEIIDEEAFWGCSALSQVKLAEGLKKIGVNAFYECTSLTSIDLPEGLKEIGSGAFMAAGLTSVAIPDSVTTLAYDLSRGEIGLGAFDCPNLAELELGNGIDWIPWGCFGSTPVKEVVIPEGVFYIDAYAFGGCEQLEKLIVSATVTRIGDMALANTKSLNQILFLGPAPNMNVAIYCSGSGAVTAACPAEYVEQYKNIIGFTSVIGYTVNDNGKYIASDYVFDESTISKSLNSCMDKYPEGYPIDAYTVSKLNFSNLTGYGSQAFAYILSDEVFSYAPSELDTTVTFNEVKAGDILRLDGDSCAVVVTEKRGDSVEVVQGDYKGSGAVHWGEVLTKAQVEAADYRITRYHANLFTDLSAVKTYAPQFPEPPVVTPTESEVYKLLLSQQSSFPEGLPYSTEIVYTTNADMTDAQISGTGQGCSAFGYYVSDLAFGNAPMREITDIAFEEIMVGDLLRYDPDPSDEVTHMVVVLEVYADRLITVEANWNESMHWGSMFTKDEVENMLGVYTRYPEGTMPAARTAFSCTHKYLCNGWVIEPTCSQPGYTTYACNSCDYSYTDNETPATGKHNYAGGYCQHCFAPEPPVSDRLEELVDSSASAMDIRDAVQNMNTHQLANALKSDESAVSNLATLEKAVGGSANVEVKNPSLGIADQDVQIIGANLNDLTAQSATLVIDEASEENSVPDGYETASAIHFSMTLENVENGKNLSVPVKLTLPIPGNLNPDRLAVVHYHDDGFGTVIENTIENIDGKNYASVVLSGFSDFAFVQRAHNPTVTAAQAPSCTTDGWTEGEFCNDCGEILVPREKMPATGHVVVPDAAVAATCIEPGKTSGSHCVTCGEVMMAQVEIPATGHNWKEATCTAPKTCKTCGATSGNAKGHNWAAGNCTTPKTCKTCGAKDGGVVHTYDSQYDYKCNVCEATRTVDMTRPMVDMFRMYDPNSGEHFYTGSMEERENLVAVGWHYEGVGFTFPLTTGKPVHRLYEPITGEHLYTMDENEMNMLLTQGWNYEGIAFNSGFENEVPQYRLHNPNATRGAYHFTASIEERDFLISVGWEYQGIGWYSLGG